MSDNVGLSTPRGSGTSGYVQRNLSHLKPRDRLAPYPKDHDSAKYRQRQPDAKILAHDRARQIEVKVFDLRDQLEDQGVDEEEIEKRVEKLRTDLLAGDDRAKPTNSRDLKTHQVHELAAAKIQESEKLRKALGIRKDYEEGGHWEAQDSRLRNAVSDQDSVETAQKTRRDR